MGAFRGHNRAQYDANMRAIRISAFYFPVVEFASSAATAAMVGVGGLMVHDRWVAVGHGQPRSCSCCRISSIPSSK